MKSITKRIKELQAENVPHLEWTDVFSQPEGAEPLTEDQQARLNDYLRQFAPLPKDSEGKPICFGCGRRFLDGVLDFLIGPAVDSTSWEWSLAHGECHCRVCGWPARAYHFDIGGKGEKAIIKRLNATLAVHPSLLQSE